jgi:hypothetical protein
MRKLLALFALFAAATAYADPAVPIKNIYIKDEGVAVSTNPVFIDFTGSGVTAAKVGTSSVTITIPGGGGSSTLDDLTDVTDTGKQTDYVLKYNGTIWVATGVASTFVFSIASFSDGLSSTIEIGTGAYRSTGTITFAASYNNGPPIGSTITLSGWSALAMSSPFTSTKNVVNLDYPSVGGTRVFTLTSQKGATTATSNITHTFTNRRWYGVSTVSSGFTESNVEALASFDLTNSKANTFSVSPTTGEYIVYAYPTRLGTATFTVGGFEGGFNSPETVSITNGFGFTENYYVYRSINSNLGSTTVVAQ